MGNPVMRFEIGAADDRALARFYGALFGWGLKAVADGYTLVDTGGWGGDQRGDRPQPERGAVGDLLRGGGGPAGVPGAGGGARGKDGLAGHRAARGGVRDAARPRRAAGRGAAGRGVDGRGRPRALGGRGGGGGLVRGPGERR